MIKISARELEIARIVCCRKLDFLCKSVLWCNQNQKDWAPVHAELMTFLDKPDLRKLILLPRNHLKSAIVTQAWTIQQVLRNPNLRVLISCNTWENARKFLGAIQKYLVQSHLSVYFGPFLSPHWNQDECTIRQRNQILVAPSWATTGTEKQMTSQHYDLIVHDDLVDDENSRTKEMREKTKDVYRNSWDLLEPGGRMVVIGTRWHQDDLYSDLINDTLFDKLVKTAYTDESRKEVIYPQKFSLEYLDMLRRPKALGGKGAYAFAAQYLNNPIDEEAADIKASQIHYYDPVSPHPTSLYLTVDPALVLGADADFSGLVVAGQFKDRRIRVVDRLRGRWVPSDLVDRIFEMMEKWKLHRMGIETFAFQKTLKYDIQNQQRKRNRFFSIDELGRRNSGKGENTLSKEARIRRLQPYFEQGLIEVRADMQDLVEEALSFPRGKHDDLLDALSYQLDYLVPSQNSGWDNLKPGQTEGTMAWWVNHHMRKPEQSIVDRFFSDIKAA